MVKDISADKRYTYSQKISAKERQVEEYKEEEEGLIKAIEEYQDSMRKSFSKIDELNQELVNQGSLPARADMDENQEMARFVKSMTEEQKEGITQVYSKLQKEAEDEIESLQHQRDNLPWEEKKTDVKEGVEDGLKV